MPASEQRALRDEAQRKYNPQLQTVVRTMNRYISDCQTNFSSLLDGKLQEMFDETTVTSPNGGCGGANVLGDALNDQYFWMDFGIVTYSPLTDDVWWNQAYTGNNFKVFLNRSWAGGSAASTFVYYRERSRKLSPRVWENAQAALTYHLSDASNNPQDIVNFVLGRSDIPKGMFVVVDKAGGVCWQGTAYNFHHYYQQGGRFNIVYFL